MGGLLHVEKDQLMIMIDIQYCYTRKYIYILSLPKDKIRELLQVLFTVDTSANT